MRTVGTKYRGSQREAEAPPGSRLRRGRRSRRGPGRRAHPDPEQKPCHVIHPSHPRVARRMRAGRRQQKSSRGLGHRVRVNVAVHQPVARRGRRPGNRHGGARLESLGHDEAPPVRRVERVRGPRSLRVHSIEEPVQVHRVVIHRRVDPAPAHGVAGREVEPLGQRPRPPVDGGREHIGARAGTDRVPRHEKDAEDEHPIWRNRTLGRIDDERPVELAVGSVPAFEGGRVGGRAPVVVRAGGARIELDLPNMAGRNSQRIAALGRPSTQPVQHERHSTREPIHDAGVNPRAGSHPDKRPGYRRCAGVGREGCDNDGTGPAISVGIPAAQPGAQRHPQHPADRPARGHPIVVEANLRKGVTWANDAGPACRHRRGREEHERDRERDGHDHGRCPRV